MSSVNKIHKQRSSIEPPSHKPWHVYDAVDVAEQLNADTEQGLTSQDASKRLDEFGKNQISEEEASPWWKILLHQFLDPLIYILFIAAVIAFAFRDFIDAGVILAVLVINGAIGFIQELRARRAIRSLAKMGAPRADVVRDGKPLQIDTEDVVPGDIVLLKSGALVPADLRLIKAQELEIDESALTGESLPASKSSGTLQDERLIVGDQSNMAFSSTIVTRGRGRGIVVRTGARSEVGKIAETVRSAAEVKAPVQKKVERLGKWIGAAIVVLTLVVTLVGWLQGRALNEIVSMAVAMAVAAIPEALPVVLTVTLAVGVRRMADRRAIIRTLPAVETLGSTTVIASDKTGTLTRNEMTVKAIWAQGQEFDVTGSGYTPQGAICVGDEAASIDDHPALQKALLASILANEAEPLDEKVEEKRGDPTELALLVAAQKVGFSIDKVRADYTQLDLIPFESERQYMASVHTIDDGNCVFIKGSPEAVVEMCASQLMADSEQPIARDALLEKSKELAAQGYRVLGTAYYMTDADQLQEVDFKGQCVFAGFLAMEDPVREEAVEAVHRAKKAGIRVMMLTGDHLHTARAIGKQLGLADDESSALEGRQFSELSDEQFDEVIRTTNIYARVAPEHKYKIVEQLKKQKHVVAVTGDGVNDAPALRAAHLGIAMGKSGTDVAREASDMVLADDNFATITAAVEEGRVVFSNIRKVTYFLLSTGVGLVLTILFALFAGWPLPYLAAQVLWINLVTKGLQDVALAFEPGEPGLLDIPPRGAGAGVIHRPVLTRMILLGVFMAAGTLVVFWAALQNTQSIEFARSMALTQMVVFQFFHVGNSRSLHRSIFKVPLFSNRFLFIAVMAAFGAQLAILYLGPLQYVFQTVPLNLEQWLLVTLVGTTVIAVAELDKWWLRRRGYGPGLDKLSDSAERPERKGRGGRRVIEAVSGAHPGGNQPPG